LVVKLKKAGVLPAPAPSAAPPHAAPAGNVVADELAAFLDKTGHALQAVPTIGTYLAAIPRLVDESPRGGRGALRFLLALTVVAGVALATEAVLRRSLSHFRHRLAAGTAPERGLASLINLGLLAILDGLGVLVVWLIFTGVLAVLFAGNAVQDRVAAIVLTGIFFWRLVVLLFRILVSPICRRRVFATSTMEAHVTYRSVSIVILLFTAG
jgi:hypothetical protein